ncbi:glycosyltransferase family 2 protein [Anaeromyxobacter oryzae]|uniref:Glycosyltransferase 2-like domain-containing protein n=1 Tax=Anaeromyxobacter oryzae TaxID=2918170 RepID=A0ABN6MXY4_9BACT|nr:glycosyltransferase family 2 protein [Anaeromyxobacter oryzae]BDG05817.1 hypothetical protein AMOR_48130 [Anaeromyxobacter oryzae]
MRLGGFVIHSSNAFTLRRCLDSLAAVCDDLVAVDTGSTDGSARLAAGRGFRVLHRKWEGYGAARAEAVAALGDCDWILFLDSDEWLEPEALEAIRRFKSNPPDAPCVEVTRHDWAELDGRRFLYRSEHHVRLVRRDHARWDRSMIVHEALPPARTVSIGASVEHLFATSIDGMRSKVDRYALLWALRHYREGRRAKWPPAQWVAHLFRELVLKGALMCARPEAWRLAVTISGYHARKYQLLREVADGRHDRLLKLLETGRLVELFEALPGAPSVGREALEPRYEPAAPEADEALEPRYEASAGAFEGK